MTEILFKLTSERLKILENDVLRHPDEDFCAFLPENIFPEARLTELNESLKGTASAERRGDFINISFGRDYLIKALCEYKNTESENPENEKTESGFFTAYARIRLASIPRKYECDFTVNSLSRTAALSAIPREINAGEYKLRLGQRPERETLAKIFYKFDSSRESDLSLDRRLISYFEEVMK